ncbi:glycoside hydrolase family 2 protein [Enterococcus termitis]|uniref:Glycoside hydrolase family 2 n=1 Tax=Enterococcus termitis TaxID=332950 RepID=A0A1E5H4Q9_9ENTE|nr:glycoside hydrolase family 2 [Enterococcus termitis]OEG19948.1 glycoside hydrolase family 2 [Enterococcus termitis]OJG97734.1 hypothetical protein RV18_GL000551 [Enterococcus termitis]
MQELRKIHPRPQFIRKNWLSLDGEWDFSFDDSDSGLDEQWHNHFPESEKIIVPYTYETKMSGIADSTHHSIVWYRKKLELENQENWVLYFEGVDYQAKVWVNGQMVGEHSGGYERFYFDISTYLTAADNEVVVRVEDSLACEQPRGKQRWLKDNFGCWYVQTTGIWKSVWLEQANAQRLGHVKMTPQLDEDQIRCEIELHDQKVTPEPEELWLEIEVFFESQKVQAYKGLLYHEMTPITLDTRVKEDACWGTKVWRPETPHLYDIVFKLYDENQQLIDEVTSYFGMRKISIEHGRVLLNNTELYQRLILDQGYWEESGLTPPSVEKLELDIDRILEMGYNGLRKHQKIEDERFLYLCDSKGVLVWSEMPSTYIFNDTAIRKFTDEWLEIVKQNYNHPSIITWVPFNESWGIKNIGRVKEQQRFTEGIYYLTKAIDSDRPVITNDGWQHTVSDIITLHDYEENSEAFFDRYHDVSAILPEQTVPNSKATKQFNKDFFAFADGFNYQGQPVIISEFGGIAFNSDEGWGYGNTVKDEKEFLKRFEAIHQVIQDMPYISGFCYTQLTDVEQEVNGLLTTQREAKVDLEEVKRINLKRVD